MEFDIQKYRQMIGKKLIDQVDKQVAVDRKLIDRKKSKDSDFAIKPNVKKIVAQYNSDSDSDSDSDINLKAIAGGKFNFIKSIKNASKEPKTVENVSKGGKIHIGKSLKNIGHSIVKDVSKGATIIKDTAIKTGANMAGKEAGEYLYNGLKEAGKSMLSSAPVIGEEAGMAVAENPELLMLAAGMEKVKKTRIVSEKEKRRHVLVKKIMKKQGVSLPEASNFIKSNNIKY
jgi:hypothetical protein